MLLASKYIYFEFIGGGGRRTHDRENDTTGAGGCSYRALDRFTNRPTYYI